MREKGVKLPSHPPLHPYDAFDALEEGATMSELVRLARQALADKVRQEAAKPGWSTAWRELATLTAGILADDPRFPPVMAALQQCDSAFSGGDWPSFQQAAGRVKAAVNNTEQGRLSP